MPASARAVHRALLLEGPRARIDLARELGLSLPTLTRVTRGLLDAGLLRELPPILQEKGRPTEPLDVDEAAGPRFLGVKITRDRLHAAVTTIRAGVLEETGLEVDGGDPGAVAEALAGLAAQMRARHPQLSGVGISLPGRVQERRRVLSAALLGWPEGAGEEIAEQIQSRIGLPVHAENDLVSLLALLHWFGAGARFRSFALITVGEGAGLGLVQEDQVVLGARSAAGRTGAFPIGEGTLEEAVATAHVLDRARRRSVIGPQGTIAELRERIAAGDPSARACAEEMTAAVARVAAGIMALADPEAILIGGETSDLLELPGGGLAARLRSLLPEVQQDVELLALGQDFEDWARGAAVIAIQAFIGEGADGGLRTVGSDGRGRDSDPGGSRRAQEPGGAD